MSRYRAACGELPNAGYAALVRVKSRIPAYAAVSVPFAPGAMISPQMGLYQARLRSRRRRHTARRPVAGIVGHRRKRSGHRKRAASGGLAGLITAAFPGSVRRTHRKKRTHRKRKGTASGASHVVRRRTHRRGAKKSASGTKRRRTHRRRAL